MIQLNDYIGNYIIEFTRVEMSDLLSTKVWKEIDSYSDMVEVIGAYDFGGKLKLNNNTNRYYAKKF